MVIPIIIKYISDKSFEKTIPLKVSSNQIKAVQSHYRQLLNVEFSAQESVAYLNTIIAHYIQIPRGEISLMLDNRISESQLLSIHFAVKALLQHKPLQYILGSTEFLDWEFELNEQVLIPRPETEELVQLIANQNYNLSSSSRILDIGTGSGCIAIALQKLTKAEVSAIDISSEALAIAKHNAQKLLSRVNFQQIDILDDSQWDNIPGDFDLIVSNPPYVQESEKKWMHKNVLEYEPALALFVSDKDPLIFYRMIAAFANCKLKKNGQLWFEINEFLSNQLIDLLKDNFSEIEIIKDYKDKNRFCRLRL